MTRYSKEQIEQIKKETIGKRIEDFYYEKDGDYYVMVFDDGSFRFMADLCLEEE